MTIFTPPEKDRKAATGVYRYLLYIVGEEWRDWGMPAARRFFWTTKPALARSHYFVAQHRAPAATAQSLGAFYPKSKKLEIDDSLRLGCRLRAIVG